MTDAAIKPITDNVEEISLDPLNKKHPSKIWLRVLLVLAVVAGILGYGIRTRMKAEADLQAVTTQMAVPSVSVVQPKPAAPAQEIILPGNIQPLISSPIYARTDGYLQKWYFDIGSHVKAGSCWRQSSRRR